MDDALLVTLTTSSLLCFNYNGYSSYVCLTNKSCGSTVVVLNTKMLFSRALIYLIYYAKTTFLFHYTISTHCCYNTCMHVCIRKWCKSPRPLFIRSFLEAVVRVLSDPDEHVHKLLFIVLSFGLCIAVGLQVGPRSNTLHRNPF